MSTNRTRFWVNLAMLTAISLVVTYLSKMIPFAVVGFLKFDFKDVIIAIGGFLFGPLAAVAIAVVSSFIEMLTFSSTGIIGCIMNIISTVAFVCPAAYIYKKNYTQKSAIIGLIIGCLAATAMMILWNYLITPLYMEIERPVVAKMLIPAFLPFNLAKTGMNAALTILIYKPVVKVLRKLNLVEKPREGSAATGKKWGGILIGVLLLATCVLGALVLTGII